MERSELKLGDLVEDRVTGLKGIATSKTEFLNGCLQVEVVPKMKEGDYAPEKAFGVSIDIQQLKRIGNGLNTPTKKVKKEETGGKPRVLSKKIY